MALLEFNTASPASTLRKVHSGDKGCEIKGKGEWGLIAVGRHTKGTACPPQCGVHLRHTLINTSPLSPQCGAHLRQEWWY